MSKDGRQEERYTTELQAQGAETVEVKVVQPPHEATGELVEMQMARARVRFTVGNDPDLEPGSRVQMAFTMVGLGESIHATLVVQDRSEGDDYCFYRLDFVSPDAFFRRVDPSIWRYFNRRRAFRVVPGRNEPSEVTVNWEGGSAEARMVDLSTGGMGLAITPAQQLPATTPVRVTFYVRESNSPIRFNGIARHQKESGGELRCGIQFIEEQDPRFEAMRDDVAAHVMRRQREMLADLRSDQTHS